MPKPATAKNLLSPSVPDGAIPTAGDHGEQSQVQGQEGPKMSRIKKQISIQDQSSRMPFRRILMVYFGIGIALMVSFMDQTGVSTSAATIGTDLHGSDSIAWAGTAFFVSNCAFHLVYGRLSDIFGRKTMLQLAVGFLLLGNLLCSFAKKPVQLYVFRAISGMGGGGVNGIAMVIVSDIVPLKDRGKYQGFISAFTSTGNAIGLFIGGGLASIGQWRWIFRINAILGAIVIILDHLVLPLKPVTGSFKTKVKQIDYVGIFLSAAGTVLILVPISGGGSTFNWDSATVIVLLCVGIVCFGAFMLAQWKISRLPILPLRLFKTPSICAVMIQSFFIGMVYYGNAFYVPIFFQYVKGYSALLSATYMLVYLFPQSLWGLIGGFYISKTNHYKLIISAGSALWTIALGLQILWHRGTPIGQVIGTLEIASIGVGWNLQTTLVAALALTPSPDRAVVTSARNFFRTMGGAFGLAMSNSIYNNVVSKHLNTIPSLTSAEKHSLLSSSLSPILSSLSEPIHNEVIDAYAAGTRTVFIAFTAVGAANFAAALFIKEVKFRRDTPELEAERRRAKGLPDQELKHHPVELQPTSLPADTTLETEIEEAEEAEDTRESREKSESPTDSGYTSNGPEVHEDKYDGGKSRHE